jgi:hypothetical protein
MTLREEFEVWAAGFWGVEVQYIRDPDQWSGQDAIVLSSAWPAWQASRAALVIELPEPDSSYENGGYLLPKDKVIESITAAGLKVRP